MADDAAGLGAEAGDVSPTKPPMPAERIALVAGLIGAAVLAALVGWLGFRVYEASTIEAQRNLFVQAARQGAVSLSTVDYEHAGADAQRILDSATGKFYDSFSHRMQSYIDNATRTRSKLVGSVTEAGLESQTRQAGRVLVAVTVRSSDPRQAEQEPQFWRMRITVQKMGDVAKVSGVEFVS
jgi:Mce-associated membrane protein